MKILRTLFSIFRRPDPSRDVYETEVQFSGWVTLPPRFRELKDEPPPAANGNRVTSA